jgi:hypothetical protein
MAGGDARPVMAVALQERFARGSVFRLTGPRAAVGRIPFANHRTQQEVREDAEARSIRRMLGR